MVGSTVDLDARYTVGDRAARLLALTLGFYA